MRRVIQVAYIYSQAANSIIHYIYCDFCATLTDCTYLEPAKVIKSKLKPSRQGSRYKPNFAG